MLTLLLAAFLSLLCIANSKALKRNVPAGFATTDGIQFSIDGKPFVSQPADLVPFLD